jgi:hypothetical protein
MRIVCRFDGVALLPVGGHLRQLQENFAVGDRLVLEPYEERSMASHKQFFASVREAWKNLPEEAADRYDTPEKLRKWALCKAGYADETYFEFESEQKAHAVAGLMRKLDEFAIVTVKQNHIRVYRAKSQSIHAMGKEDFEASKRAVLDILSGTIGVSRKALEQEGKAGRN